MSGTAVTLRHDCRGSFASEFAMVLPIFLFLIVGLIEIFVLLFANGALHTAVGAAARYGATGQDDGARADVILQTIAQRTFGLVDMEAARIDIRVYPSFASIGQGEPFTDTNGNGLWDETEPFTDINGNGKFDQDLGEAGLGGPGDVVLYRVSFATSFVTGLLDPLFGEVRYTAAVAVRNEPF